MGFFKSKAKRMEVDADGLFVGFNNFRAADLHESDPYWDEDSHVWRRAKDDTYDDEANDLRPNSEKYNNSYFVIAMMCILLAGLIWLLIHIFNNLCPD